MRGVKTPTMIPYMTGRTLLTPVNRFSCVPPLASPWSPLPRPQGRVNRDDVDGMTAGDFEQYLEGGARSKSNPGRLPFDGPEPSPPLDAVLRTSGEMR